jgi:hypothetical protein
VAQGAAVARVLDALERAGAQPRPRGEHYEFFCPVHADGTNAAGELRQGNKGALVTCHAGCDREELVGSIGLRMADLFDEEPKAKIDWQNPDARYPYVDETGEVLYEVRRWGSGKSKVIRPGHFVGGRWEPGMPDCARVPYRLPEVIAAVTAGEPVLVVEGEKDVETARARGLTATCNVGGAKKWRSEYDRYFAGAAVVIVADNDAVGMEHARMVAGHLGPVAGDVVVMRSKAGNDLSDHVAAGHDITYDLVPVDLDAETAAASTNGHGAAAAPAVEATKATSGQSWPVMDPAAFYGIPGEAVRAISPYTEADPAAILLQLLCVIGVSIGPAPRIHAGLEPQPARLQVWVVGESAIGRKGSSWGAARAIMNTADQGFMETRVLSGFGSGEALVDAAADESARDCRLLVLAREGGHLLSVIKRQGDTTSTVLRDAYDTDTLAVRSRAKTSIARQAHIGLIAHITPADLVGMLTETQIRNGFANRGLFCSSRRPHLIPRGGPAPRSVDDIAARLGDAIRRARVLVEVRFSHDAGNAWDEAYGRFGADAPSPLLADLEARGDMHALRLAMILALLDGTPVIEVHHLDAALAVWRYCRDSARYVFGPDGAMEDARELSEMARLQKRFEDDLARLDEALQAAGQLSGREQRLVFTNNRSAAHIGRLRKELIARGQAAEVNENTGGRPRRLLVTVER